MEKNFIPLTPRALSTLLLILSLIICFCRPFNWQVKLKAQKYSIMVLYLNIYLVFKLFLDTFIDYYFIEMIWFEDEGNHPLPFKSFYIERWNRII